MSAACLALLAACAAWPVRAASSESLARSAAAEAAGDAAQSWELASGAARQAPEDASVRARAASAALAARRYEQALEEASAALKLGGPTAALYQVRSAAQAGMGRHREALADAESALGLNPASAAGRLRRAQALEGLGQKRGALEDYRRAAELDHAQAPIYEEAYLRLARAPKHRRRLWAVAGAVLLAAAALSLLRRRRRSLHVRFGSVISLPPAGDDPPPGRVLAGRFIVGRALDRGTGAQQIYEGRDLEDRSRLIRRFMPSLEPRRGFRLSQAQAACRLRHAGLAPLEAAFEASGSSFVVQEPYVGETLISILEKAPGRRLPPESIARAARTLCEGIDAAHAAGLVHGRVSAREIIVEGDAWRLTGLGLPGAAHADIVPPEGDAETKEGDLYGLAVCLYEALAGDKPFSGPEGSLAKSEGRPASLAGRVGLPPGLDAFFARALQSDPARRFHAACELYGALRSLVTPAVH